MNLTDFISIYCTPSIGSQNTANIQVCLQGLYNLGVTLAVAIAFLFVVFGAFKYILGAASNQKGAGKQIIMNAIYGLAFIFISGTILYWVNPAIFKAELIIYNVKKLDPPEFIIDAAPVINAGATPVQGRTAIIPPGCPQESDLVAISGQGLESNKKIRKDILPHLQRVGQAAHALGYKIVITQGYRSYQDQVNIWNHWGQNPRYAARPDPTCKAPHQTGGAVDGYLVRLRDGKKFNLNYGKRNGADNMSQNSPGRADLEKIFFQDEWARYVNEYWHYEYGTGRWQQCSGRAC